MKIEIRIALGSTEQERMYTLDEGMTDEAIEQFVRDIILEIVDYQWDKVL